MYLQQQEASLEQGTMRYLHSIYCFNALDMHKAPARRHLLRGHLADTSLVGP